MAEDKKEVVIQCPRHGKFTTLVDKDDNTVRTCPMCLMERANWEYDKLRLLGQLDKLRADLRKLLDTAEGWK